MSKNSTNKAKQPTDPKVRSRTLQKTKRNTKDSVFTHLFSFPKYQLELYQALHPEDTDVCEADIGTITRECRDKGILAEYIKKMEGEIMDIMTYMFDEENNKRLFGLEQWRLGEKKGIEKGKKDEKQQTAINLLNMNIDIAIIEKATGLSKTEILKLNAIK